MLFNSFSFGVFFPVVFIVYWLLKRKTVSAQNTFLLIASYYFYGCWDWRFLFLLAFSTVLDYFTGMKIHDSTEKVTRKTWLWISVGINIGFLGIFKYYNFFADSFSDLMTASGFRVHITTLQIILPVGISFYTFHGLSYVFDIYNRKIEPERNPVNYALFVSFFPLLVAGPIERATHLLPQIIHPRTFSIQKATDGLRQMAWGFFKKMVIADNCAKFSNEIFDNNEIYPGSMLILGAIFFAFQIYGDFSGYSDIALGSARLLGIELLQNFRYPYFSRDIAEFWRRWHISLSSWFRDYLYVPLGGSKKGIWISIRNTFIIFTVSGFWHGANWTFIVWGILNAIFFLPLLLTKRNRVHLEIVAHDRWLPTPAELISMLVTFALTTLAWIFFRAENLTHAFEYLGQIFSPTLFVLPHLEAHTVVTMLLIVFMITIEWSGRRGPYALALMNTKMTLIPRWVCYCILIFITLLFMVTEESPFIYFQF